MKGFLYPLLILLFTNQTSAQIDERKALLPRCEAFNEDERPQGPKSEVERCCFWVSCHFFSCFASLFNGPCVGTIQGARTLAALPFNADGLQKQRRKITAYFRGRFFVSESLINQQQHQQTKAAGEGEREAEREGVRGREGGERE